MSKEAIYKTPLCLTFCKQMYRKILVFSFPLIWKAICGYVCNAPHAPAVCVDL